MRNLPDIVRAIALNNKIDESRDFASMVQNSLKYKQQIAEALFAGVLRYQQALKKVPAIAARRP
jgi:hypothetical protein